ncbi:Y-family DNA polymerase [Candidatus Saccharibacteria bacterium]|nr:Y-family DNA polymerase [Candidatus Saccharibacteria bacterium]
MTKSYIAIDLKSFYASVECVERGLDPLKAKLVVADQSRTDKTICLAVSPTLKQLGIPGRARLFEVKQKAKDFIIAKPRMAFYISYSTRIYNIYLKYIAEEDIHVYSIDEVFIDATPYLKAYHLTARELATRIIKDVLKETGITATVGIGTNLYLAKVAMDIVAKHEEPDQDGVRIAELDEMSYRQKLWDHQPLTDFWRVGKGYAKRLNHAGLYTMGDIALCSEYDEDYLYKMFGINAELLIDHAWGWEPCEIKDIKACQPKTHSFSSGQVLKEPYSFKKARVVATEMAEEIGLSLLSKGLVTDQVVLTIGYDKTSMAGYTGEAKPDFYGRLVPRHAHGTYNLKKPSSLTSEISHAVTELFDNIVNPDLFIRRITINVNHIVREKDFENSLRQLDLFSTTENTKDSKKEKRQNEAILAIKKRYGRNAILKGINFEEGATGRERNAQIGGHKA